MIDKMLNIYETIRCYKGSKKWEYIIIHHSQTKDRITADWEAIRRWHTGQIPGSPYKWDDIGYHFGLESVNEVLTYQIGRSLDIFGAHCRGRNHDGLGICLIGSYDDNAPTHEQYFAMSSLCRYLMEKFDIPIHNVLGHRSFSEKSCPGELFNIVKLRNYIKGEISKYSISS